MMQYTTQELLETATTALRDLHVGYPAKEIGLTSLLEKLVTHLRGQGIDDEGGWDCPATEHIPVAKAGTAYTTSAQDFVSEVANMSLWGTDDDSGNPACECDEPDEGYEDSHSALMSLIELARKVDQLESRMLSKAPVRHWSDYGPEADGCFSHEIEIEDNRADGGRVYLTCSAIDGRVDDLMSVTAEVHTSPVHEDTTVPCMHVHFDDDNLAMSLFKIDDRIILRPEAGVTMKPFVRDGQSMYEIY